MTVLPSRIQATVCFNCHRSRMGELVAELAGPYTIVSLSHTSPSDIPPSHTHVAVVLEGPEPYLGQHLAAFKDKYRDSMW